MNQEAFLVHVDKALGQTLKPGHIVVMDNLPAHKGGQVRNLIRKRGATRRFLPAYSPDPNPIGLAFAKFKSLLSAAAGTTVTALWDRIAEILQAFTPRQCANCSRHDGYAST